MRGLRMPLAYASMLQLNMNMIKAVRAAVCAKPSILVTPCVSHRVILASRLHPATSCSGNRSHSRTAASATASSAGTAARDPSTSSAPSTSGRSRAYPDEPRVGVGIVVFRRPVTVPGDSHEILLIRRAKEPAKGQWCFPGGSLELGESLASCAVREVLEETGLHIRNNPDAIVEGFSRQLQQPIPFAAVDSIVRDEQGQLKFHYVVVEAAAMASDPEATPVASDDVDGVQWMEVSKLRQLDNLTKNCAAIAEEAVQRFDLSC